MNAAAECFYALASPLPVDSHLIAVDFPGFPAHRIGKAADGSAVVLIRTRPGGGRRFLPPLATEFLRVTYSGPYSVRYESGSTEEGQFASLACVSSDAAIVRLFFTFVTGLLETLPPSPSVDETANMIRDVVQMFRALSLPASETVQGIWAELFIIATSRSKACMARAWHHLPSEISDFSAGGDRLEVKSSSRRRRLHHFSLKQLDPPVGARIWIASLFVERTAGGTSLATMLEMACAGLHSADTARLHRVTAETLGAGLPSGLEMAFDLELARDSLQYFDATTLPRPLLPLPLEITELRFVADISRVPSMKLIHAGESTLLQSLPEPGSVVGLS